MGLLDKSGAPLFGDSSIPQLVLPKDTDLTHDSPHHTLGAGPLQAAPGNHQHDGRYVNVDGDTMTDNLAINKPNTEVQLKLQSDANASLRLEKGDGTNRWTLWKDAATESGSNVGSDFSIGSYNDDGSWNKTHLKIKRSNGVTTVFDGLNATKCISIDGGDLNTLRGTGWFDGSNLSNAPNGSTSWYYVHQIEHSNNGAVWRKQILYGLNVSSSQPVQYERHLYSGSWTSWQHMGQAAQYTVTPATNWAAYGGNWGNYPGYVTKHGQLCVMQGLIKATTTVSFAANGYVSLGTLPSSGFYPIAEVMTSVPVSCSVGSNIQMRLNIAASGLISVIPHAAGNFAAGQWVGMSASWLASP